MAHVRTFAGGAVLGAAFIALFVAAGGVNLPSTKPTPTPAIQVRGNVGEYLYSITPVAGQNKKLAQFDPALPADDTLLVNTLTALAKDGYGVVIDPNVQPAVETIDEINYVTFTVGQKKLLFELFRNSTGEVGSARFWLENASGK